MASLPSPSSSTALRTQRVALGGHVDGQAAAAALEPLRPDIDARLDVAGDGQPGQGRHRAAADQQAHAPARGSRRSVLNHPTTCRSTWSAAWLPPPQLLFMAAASASAKMPMGAGGGFTQPQKRGWPFPNGYGATCAANSSRIASTSCPAFGGGSPEELRGEVLREGLEGRLAGRLGQILGDQIDDPVAHPPDLLGGPTPPSPRFGIHRSTSPSHHRRVRRAVPALLPTRSGSASSVGRSPSSYRPTGLPERQ